MEADTCYNVGEPEDTVQSEISYEKTSPVQFHYMRHLVTLRGGKQNGGNQEVRARGNWELFNGYSFSFARREISGDWGTTM